MANQSTFPTTLDGTPTDRSLADAVPSADWNKYFDGIDQLEQKVGVNSSTASGSLDYKLEHHHTQHENSGNGEISVTDLSGLLADDQHIAYTGVTKASLPPAGTIGKIRRVTDDIHGLWMDQGSQWFGLNGEIVNAKEFGAKGDDLTDDTVTINAAIAAANAIAGLNKPTLYFPAGVYRVQSNALTAIQCNVYGPDATIRALATQTNTLHLVRVNYSATIGQTFVLRAIQGANYGGTTPYNCGLEIIGADNSVFRINQLELLDTGISLSGPTGNHVAQNTFYVQTCMSVNIGFNVWSGLDRVEANTFHIEYLRPGIANGIGVYMGNQADYTCNNIFKINVMELHYTAGEIGFKLTGVTPAKITQNVFEVSGNLTVPGVGGKWFHCDANIGRNIFRLCRDLLDHQDVMTFSSAQLLQMSDSHIAAARSLLWGGGPPASGYYEIGSVCWNSAGAIPNGWRCTTAGAPGSWSSF